MKKFLFSILLALLLYESVNARTYYSAYSDFTEYSLVPIESSDIINVEEKKVYNKYFDVAQGDYYALDESPVIYPYINVNIFRDTDYTEWQIDYPTDKLGRIIETKNVCDNDSCTLSHFEYRYKDRLYYHYYKKTILLNENLNLNGYIKDENDYVSYYRYQIRDKIEINDKIIILNKLDSIDNFIISTVPYSVVGSINYSKNGIYNINVKTSFIDIPLTVEVLLTDNLTEEFNSIINDKDLNLSNLNSKIIDLERSLTINNDLNNNLKKENKDLNIKILDFKNKLNTVEEINQVLINENNLLNDKLNISLEDNNILSSTVKEYLNNNDNLKSLLLKFELDIKNYKQKILNLNDLLLSKDNSINMLNNKMKKYELEKEETEDYIKKLNLCNDANSYLEKEVSNNEEINKQDVFYIVFISIIFFFVILGLLKIKSMKKNN